jgi:hypothetical protein
LFSYENSLRIPWAEPCFRAKAAQVSGHLPDGFFQYDLPVVIEKKTTIFNYARLVMEKFRAVRDERIIIE